MLHHARFSWGEISRRVQVHPATTRAICPSASDIDTGDIVVTEYRIAHQRRKGSSGSSTAFRIFRGGATVQDPQRAFGATWSLLRSSLRVMGSMVSCGMDTMLRAYCGGRDNCKNADRISIRCSGSVLEVLCSEERGLGEHG